MKGKNGKIITFLQNNGLQLAITIIGFLITLGNVYISARLAPLVSRTEKLEIAETANATDHENFVHLDTQKEINTRIEGKIDLLLSNFHLTYVEK